jgi:hypothetical protein
MTKTSGSVIDVEKNGALPKCSPRTKQTYWADKVIVANGRDTQFLFPEHYNGSRMKNQQIANAFAVAP